MKLILTAKALKKDGVDSANKAESSVGNKGKRKTSGEKQQKRKRTKTSGKYGGPLWPLNCFFSILW